ncbi:MAG: hypothetical protein WAL80_06125 [Xanthobacteraceae bacterium]
MHYADRYPNEAGQKIPGCDVTSGDGGNVRLPQPCVMKRMGNCCRLSGEWPDLRHGATVRTLIIEGILLIAAEHT